MYDHLPKLSPDHYIMLCCVLLCRVLLCRVLLCCVVLCCVVLCCVVLCSVVLCCVVLCCVVLCCVVLCCVVLCCVVLCCVAQCYDMLCMLVYVYPLIHCNYYPPEIKTLYWTGQFTIYIYMIFPLFIREFKLPGSVLWSSDEN